MLPALRSPGKAEGRTRGTLPRPPLRVRFAHPGCIGLAHELKRRHVAGVSSRRETSTDQEILEPLARARLRCEPSRLLAAAGPGFRRIGRVAVLRRDGLAGVL